jgi:hypothetical protein
MKIGKLISMFVVSSLLSLSLAMGANVNAQTTGGAKLRKTSEMQEKKAGKKKHGKSEHKKHHHRSY